MRNAEKPGLFLPAGALQEARDRAEGCLDLCLDLLFARPPAYETVNWEDGLRDLEAHLGRVEDLLGEPALAEVEENTRRLLEEIRHKDPFSPRWAADSLLARCSYLVCRLLEPQVVAETGVAYGVSSAFILRALEENGHGILHSVDLPPLRKRCDEFWGIAVDGTLRSRWSIHRGSSKRVLPELLEEYGVVDLFLHDSLHTYRNMRRELEFIWLRLRAGGVILADDVERNRAFGDLRRKNPALWRVVRDRQERPLHAGAVPRATFGIAIK
ncbi:MAG: class I SAM-dependent methyltransferase [Rubrobacteraceae bacterium]